MDTKGCYIVTATAFDNLGNTIATVNAYLSLQQIKDTDWNFLLKLSIQGTHRVRLDISFPSGVVQVK